MNDTQHPAVQDLESLGLIEKYKISKSSGEPVDPSAIYFVLRLDTDRAARNVMRVYAKQIRGENAKLASDLDVLLKRLG